MRSCWSSRGAGLRQGALTNCRAGNRLSGSGFFSLPDFGSARRHYAQKLFDLTSRWGRQFLSILRAKSRALVGGEVSGKGAKTVTVKEVLLSRKADVFLSYTSNAGNYPAESFRTLQIPTDENVDARYGMLLMTSRAAPLSRWLESQEALRLMAEAGFRA